LEYLADHLGVSDDYMVRVLDIAGHDAALCFISTVANRDSIEKILNALHRHQFPKKKPKNLAQYIIERVLTASETVFLTNLYEIREAVASGDAVLFIDGVSPAIVFNAQFVEHRSPEQPFIESASRGSQISFVEDLSINVGLIRRAIRSDTLRVKKLKVGFRSRTDVAVIYLDDVANPTAVDTVIRRLMAVHVAVVGQSATLEQLIVDNRWTLFPLTRTTQRIDSTVREINRGKIAIVVDNDPVVLVVPATLLDFFRTEEDYAHVFYESTMVRWLRIISAVLAIYLPALYVSFVDYNPELLPKVLGLQITRSREGIPFPAIAEVILMTIVVEILREAALRMPKQMGQTIGIVGGLVVGEASVQAGLVSNILIIVIALTAVSIFVSPSYEMTIVQRLVGWLFILSSGLFGLYGVILMTVLLLYHVASLKSFGISYLDPFNGEHVHDLLVDSVVRVPIFVMDERSGMTHPTDPVSATDYQNPVPHPQLEKTEMMKQPPRRTP
ncbi:MAG: spore germination protein, partial [Alicyclobacillus sp.]|nr:spore germination protein [Alicyclobacillus sp.]